MTSIDIPHTSGKSVFFIIIYYNFIILFLVIVSKINFYINFRMSKEASNIKDTNNQEISNTEEKMIAESKNTSTNITEIL